MCRFVWISLAAFCFVAWSMSGLVGCEETPKDETPVEAVDEKTEPKDGGTTDNQTPTETAPDAGGKESTPEKAKDANVPPDEPVGPEPNPNVGKIRWSASTTGSVKSVALSADETELYVAAGRFTTYDAKTGNEKWIVTNLGEDLSAPTVSPDGLIFVGSNNKKLYAISPSNKSVSWDVTLAEPANFYPPAISKDGKTVYAVAGNTLYAYGASDGKAAWGANYVVTAGIVSGVSVDGDGTLYVCGKDGSLHAVKSDGTKKWDKSIGKEPCRAPAIDADGTIYAAGDTLYALKPDGDVKWTVTDYPTVTSGIVIQQSFLYFATFSGKLFKANKSDGSAASILWENGITLVVTGAQDFAPTMGAGGLIYVATGGTSPALKFLSPVDGKTQYNILASRHEYSGTPAIAKDGTLYVGNNQGTVFAVWTNSPGLANSPWPRATHDNQNTGRFK